MVGCDVGTSLARCCPALLSKCLMVQECFAVLNGLSCGHFALSKVATLSECCHPVQLLCSGELTNAVLNKRGLLANAMERCCIMGHWVRKDYTTAQEAQHRGKRMLA